MNLGFRVTRKFVKELLDVLNEMVVLMNKSNRDVEELLELFEPLFGFKVSYKTIERVILSHKLFKIKKI